MFTSCPARYGTPQASVVNFWANPSRPKLRLHPHPPKYEHIRIDIRVRPLKNSCFRLLRLARPFPTPSMPLKLRRVYPGAFSRHGLGDQGDDASVDDVMRIQFNTPVFRACLAPPRLQKQPLSNARSSCQP